MPSVQTDRIRAGFNPSTFSPKATEKLSSAAKSKAAISSPYATIEDALPLDELMQALDDGAAASGVAQPPPPQPRPASKTKESRPRPSTSVGTRTSGGVSGSGGSGIRPSTAGHAVPASVATPPDASAPSERSRKPHITSSLDDHYVNPVLAKKLAAAAAADASGDGDTVDEHESKLAAARIEAFASRKALALKHGQHINPVAGTAPAVRHPRTSIISLHSEEDSVRSDEAPRARGRHLGEPGGEAADASGHRRDVPPPAAAPAATGSTATPPRKASTHGVEGGAPTVSLTPQQMRAARLAEEQRQFEEQLAAARRQAFEERLQLQMRYGRGV